jgi:hypothetical protein
LKAKYTINKKDKLYVDYAENLNKMIQRAANNQYKLLYVINELFTYVIDPYSKKRVIRVNPKLNDEMLQKSVEKTRRFIIDLYVNCENDYVNGVKLYEAIVESKIIETTKKQIENLKNKANEMIETTQKTVITENHKIFYKGKIIKAKEFINNYENDTKIEYTGEILYNVLMEEHDKMIVNNLICETLDPENTIAKLHCELQALNPKEQEKRINMINKQTLKDIKKQKNKKIINVKMIN